MFKSPWYRCRNYTSHQAMVRTGGLLDDSILSVLSLLIGQVVFIADPLAVHLHPLR